MTKLEELKVALDEYDHRLLIVKLTEDEVHIVADEDLVVTYNSEDKELILNDRLEDEVVLTNVMFDDVMEFLSVLLNCHLNNGISSMIRATDSVVTHRGGVHQYNKVVLQLGKYKLEFADETKEVVIYEDDNRINLSINGITSEGLEFLIRLLRRTDELPDEYYLTELDLIDFGFKNNELRVNDHLLIAIESDNNYYVVNINGYSKLKIRNRYMLVTIINLLERC